MEAGVNQTKLFIILLLSPSLLFTGDQRTSAGYISITPVRRGPALSRVESLLLDYFKQWDSQGPRPSLV